MTLHFCMSRCAELLLARRLRADAMDRAIRVDYVYVMSVRARSF
jgi:hypothetical protein